MRCDKNHEEYVADIMLMSAEKDLDLAIAKVKEMCDKFGVACCEEIMEKVFEDNPAYVNFKPSYIYVKVPYLYGLLLMLDKKILRED